MPLEQNHVDQLKKHFDANSGLKRCPFCSAGNWTIGEIIASPTFSSGTVSVGGSFVPVVQVICSQCGYVMQFAAKVAGLV